MEYEFSVESNAFHGIYGLFTDKIKQSFKVRSEDEYFTLHFIANRSRSSGIYRITGYPR